MRTKTKKPPQKPIRKVSTMERIPAQRIKQIEAPKTTVMEKYKDAGDIISQIIIDGDISKLNNTQRVTYYRMYCESLGLNPVTKPFDILNLKGKIVLYANKDCAAQLRESHGVHIDEIHVETVNDLYSVVVKGHDKTGKTDCELGVVPIKGLSGESLANAMMKATTKAKRRLTLSICGLSALDETEIDSIPGAKITTTYTEDGQSNGEHKKLDTSSNDIDLDEVSDIFDGKPATKSHIVDPPECPQCQSNKSVRKSKYAKPDAWWYCYDCKPKTGFGNPVEEAQEPMPKQNEAY